MRTNSDEAVLPRKRKRFEVGEGECSHSSTVEDYFRGLYCEALDLAITCIQDRFSQPGYKLYHNLEELLVRAAHNEDHSEQLREVISFYGSDFEEGELCTLLQIFGSCFTNLSNSKEVT